MKLAKMSLALGIASMMVGSIPTLAATTAPSTAKAAAKPAVKTTAKAKAKKPAAVYPMTFVCVHCKNKITVKKATDLKATCSVCKCGLPASKCKPAK